MDSWLFVDPAPFYTSSSTVEALVAASKLLAQYIGGKQAKHLAVTAPRLHAFIPLAVQHIFKRLRFRARLGAAHRKFALRKALEDLTEWSSVVAAPRTPPSPPRSPTSVVTIFLNMLKVGRPFSDCAILDLNVV